MRGKGRKERNRKKGREGRKKRDGLRENDTEKEKEKEREFSTLLVMMECDHSCCRRRT